MSNKIRTFKFVFQSGKHCTVRAINRVIAKKVVKLYYPKEAISSVSEQTRKS